MPPLFAEPTTVRAVLRRIDCCPVIHRSSELIGTVSGPLQGGDPEPAGVDATAALSAARNTDTTLEGIRTGGVILVKLRHIQTGRGEIRIGGGMVGLVDHLEITRYLLLVAAELCFIRMKR